jgi:hypothetical protein
MAVDVTQSGVNNYFANALESDSQPADGVLDIGFVLTFDPLDQTDDNGGQFVLVNAACTAPAPSMSCTLAPGTFAFNSTYLSSITECYAPDPDELSTYDDPPSSPSPTMGPCFVTQPFDVTLITPAFTMPLSSATVAARYAGDPADELLQGNVRGFISESVASTVMLNSAVFNNTSLADVLRAEDMDQNATGWMFHVSFTAVPVDYDGG